VAESLPLLSGKSIYKSHLEIAVSTESGSDWVTFLLPRAGSNTGPGRIHHPGPLSVLTSLSHGGFRYMVNNHRTR